jgi:hypothetical protein
MNNDEESGTINFRFKLEYAGQPMKMFSQYEYPVTKDKFMMSRLSFFISDLSIRSSSGDLLLKDIDYVNLTNSHTDPISSNGLEYKVTGVKAGNYSGFAFGVGVPKVSNALSPKDFSANHILSGSAEYWATWKSYIFFRPEGQIAINGKPITETTFALHLGSDDAYRKITLNKPIQVVNGQETNVDIILDVEKYFNGKTWYDIAKVPQIHTIDKISQIGQLADNLVTAFK